MFKKGQLGGGIAVILGLVFVTIMLVVAGLIVGKLKDAMTSNTAEYNATAKSIEGITSFANLQPVLWILGAITLVIAMVFGFMRFGSGKGR